MILAIRKSILNELMENYSFDIHLQREIKYCEKVPKFYPEQRRGFLSYYLGLE